jgi:hypothetical protein
MNSAGDNEGRKTPSILKTFFATTAIRSLIRRKRSAATPEPSVEGADGDVVDFLQKRRDMEARRAASQAASRFSRAVKKINIIQSTRTPSSSISPQGEAALIGTAARSEDSKVYNTVKASRAVINRFKMGIAEGDENEDDDTSYRASNPSSNPTRVPAHPPIAETQQDVPEVHGNCEIWEDSGHPAVVLSATRRHRNDNADYKQDSFGESGFTELDPGGAEATAAVVAAAAEANHSKWLEAECDDLRRSLESLKM